MKRSLYSASLNKFKNDSEYEIMGNITINGGDGIEQNQKFAWTEQIKILKRELASFQEGHLIFEYTIPRIGKKVDNVLIYNGIIYLLEFKVGDDEYHKYAVDQVMDYALDLKYFHEESKKRILVPIIISTRALHFNNQIEKYDDQIIKTLRCNSTNIGKTICAVEAVFEQPDICAEDWEQSKYMPTPNIIEAAQALYGGHSVKDISRSDSGAINLNKTMQAINTIINEAKDNKKKSICFITGVPGAGKTLAGLNIANERHNFDEKEHAVFLSGNGPLVDVLQEALARNQAATELPEIKISEARRKAKSFIQIIHHFRDEALRSDLPPTEKVVIFDEAQRAWNKKQTSKFMRTKKGLHDFDMSEPEFLIDYMDRHKDWAVIICLVGGGQEINTGEAGLGEWFDAIKERYPHWNVFVSDRITDDEYKRGRSLSEILDGITAKYFSELHLSVSLRSFRSENVSEFVRCLINADKKSACDIYNELKDNYKIVLTRDIEKAKTWIKRQARGTERYGLIASSGAIRLKAKGIFVKNKVDAKNWFLNDDNDVRSSYYLEDVATEFDIQGLELDYMVVAWGADFRFNGDGFEYKQFKGSKWMNTNKKDNRLYLKNAYRVLLTRARQGMAIYIPYGESDDITRPCEYYDGTYKYLKSLGLKIL